MERKLSAFSELREKKTKGSHSESVHRLAAGIGAFSSLAFILCLVAERPKLGIVISLVAATVLIAFAATRWWKQNHVRKQTLNIAALRSNAIIRYIPWANSNYFGNPTLIQNIFQAIDRDLNLASHSKALGLHLFLAPRGSGKSHLIQLIEQCLFGSKNKIEFDFKSLDRESFAEAFLEMISTINQHPYQLIVLDHVDCAEAAMLEPFLEILKTNQWKIKGDHRLTQFSGCLFVATATLPVEKTNDLNDSKIKLWLDQSESVDSRFVIACSEIFSWGQPTLSVMAQVACKRLSEYWKEHSIELQSVSPEALLSIIKEASLQKSQGLHPLSQVIRKRSARALEQTMKKGLLKMNLSVEKNGDLYAGRKIA